MDREAWRAAIHGVAKSRTWLSDWTELKATQNINKIREKITIISQQNSIMNFLRLISFRIYISEDIANTSHLFWECGDGILVGVPFADARETEQPLWHSGCYPGLTSIFKKAPWGSKIRTVTCTSIQRETFQPRQEASCAITVLCFCLKQWGVQTTDQQLL